MDEPVSVAFLAVLERLSPTEGRIRSIANQTSFSTWIESAT
jgi:hypothetical protein